MKKKRYLLILTVLSILLLQSSLSYAQSDSTATIDTAKVLLVEGKYNKSIDVLKIILSKDSANAEAYFYLSLCFQNLSNYQKAAEALTKALVYEPGNINMMVSLGNDLFASGRFSDAENILLHALKLDSANSMTLISLGKVLMRKHNWEKALKIYNKLIKNDPNNSFFYEQAAKCNSILKNIDNAIIDYQIAHRLNPQNENTIIQLSNLYYSKKQFISAKRIVDDGLAVYPYSTEIWTMKGKIFLSLKKYSDAVVSYSNSIKYGDSSLTNFRDIGICYYCTGKYDSAIGFLKTAIKINPKDPASFYYLGTSDKGLNNNDTAVTYLSKAADLLKNDFLTEIYTQLASSYYSLKNYKKALNYYKDALRENPKKTEINFYIAAVYERLYRDKTVAMNYYKKFLADSAKSDKKLVNYAVHRLTALREYSFMNNKK